MEVLVFPGSDGEFSLYEEYEGAAVWSDFVLDWGKGIVTVKVRSKERIGIKRRYQFVFPCWETAGKPEVRVNGDIVFPEIVQESNAVQIIIDSSIEASSISIDWKAMPQVSEIDYRQEIFEFLKEAQISFTQKEQIYRLAERYGKSPLIIQELSAMHLNKEVYEVICELLWACG